MISHFNDFTNCWRGFNVVIMILYTIYISAVDHARKLKFSNYVLLACINTIYKYGYKYGHALENSRVLKLSSYVFIAYINTK